MISRIRAQLGHAGLVVAIVALVAALAGGAYAASGGLTGKQKKEVEKIAKKVGKPGAPGAPGTAGANGKDGANGANGKDGVNGTPGAPGANGKSVATGTEPVATGNCGGRGGSWVEVEGSASRKFACNGQEGSPWTAGGTLPSEATETGIFTMKLNGGAEEYLPISFPIPLSEEAAEDTAVHHWVEGGIQDAQCTGTVLNPTAAAGSLCVYIGVAGEGSLKSSSANPTPPTGGVRATLDFPEEIGPSGTFIYWENASAQTMTGSWAVTAP
jgi:hypothetical protein